MHLPFMYFALIFCCCCIRSPFFRAVNIFTGLEICISETGHIKADVGKQVFSWNLKFYRCNKLGTFLILRCFYQHFTLFLLAVGEALCVWGKVRIVKTFCFALANAPFTFFMESVMLKLIWFVLVSVDWTGHKMLQPILCDLVCKQSTVHT